MVKTSNGSPYFTPLLPPSYLAVRSPYLSGTLPFAMGFGPCHSLLTLIPFQRGYLVVRLLTFPRISPSSGPGRSQAGLPLPVSKKATNGQHIVYLGLVETMRVLRPLKWLAENIRQLVFRCNCGQGYIHTGVFSLVSPKNFVRQSLPFNHLTVTA